MKKKIEGWHSESLGQEMKIATYGHFGYTLLLFSALEDNFLEYEENGLIDRIRPCIEQGRCKVFSVGTDCSRTWMNQHMSGAEKSKHHQAYNNYISEEVVPYIFNDCASAVPIITAGAEHGAFHAANTYFRRPDVFLGTVAMSGAYNLEAYTEGYFDDNCYFNSPTHYLPNLEDEYLLSYLKNRHHVYFLSGGKEKVRAQESTHLSDILKSKDIPHELEIWDESYGNNWDTWNKMAEHIVSNKM